MKKNILHGRLCLFILLIGLLLSGNPAFCMKRKREGGEQEDKRKKKRRKIDSSKKKKKTIKLADCKVKDGEHAGKYRCRECGALYFSAQKNVFSAHLKSIEEDGVCPKKRKGKRKKYSFSVGDYKVSDGEHAGKYRCRECGAIYLSTQREAFWKHLKKLKERGVCPKKKKKYSFRIADYKVPDGEEHAGKYRCRECGTLYLSTQRRAFGRHLEKLEEDGVCPKKRKGVQKKRKGVQKKYSFSVDDYKVPDGEEHAGKYRCRECGVFYLSTQREAFWKHLKKLEKDGVCSKKKKGVQKKYSFRVDDYKVPDGEEHAGKYRCRECGFFYLSTQREAFWKHLKKLEVKGVCPKKRKGVQKKRKGERKKYSFRIDDYKVPDGEEHAGKYRCRECGAIYLSDQRVAFYGHLKKLEERGVCPKKRKGKRKKYSI